MARTKADASGKKPLLMSVADVCREINVTRRTLQYWFDSGHFPKPFKVGQQHRWRTTVVEEWIRVQERTTTKAV